MAAFREALGYCDLYDLWFNGQWYTWERGRLVKNNIRERLDRGVANMKWWDLFPRYKVNRLQHSFSDHCPVVVDTFGNKDMQGGVKQWHFRFDANWVLNDEVNERLKQEWNSNSLDVLEKLEKVGSKLSNWVKGEKQRKDQRRKYLNGRLLELGASEISDVALEEITEIKLELNIEADKDELYWEQRARVNWLRIGDRNTTFFHKSATHRRRKNRIKGLENEVGKLITDEHEITILATKYFKELFSSKPVKSHDRLFESFLPCITDKHNGILMQEFKEE
ncbi:uncharacterized protein [Gossypium hirsutum]|uniref:Reverse transcriptase n=1 Tax=Gossypium hirsutum TaxID=3635 RepID=A0A1U8P7V5_GOSHI|nr:uncharacterized protein LOC107955950 [Gossypium hirsutum]